MQIATRTWIDAIVKIDPVHAETMQEHPVRIDVSQLPFYRRGTMLVQAQIQLPQRLIDLCYAGAPQTLRTLHHVRDLMELNAVEKLRIEPSELPAYLRLHLMVAGQGRWRLIERMSDVPFHPRLLDADLTAWKRRIAAEIHPVRAVEEHGTIRASIVMLDRSDLAELDLWIEPDGNMGVRRTRRLLDGVPVRALRR